VFIITHSTTSLMVGLILIYYISAQWFGSECWEETEARDVTVAGEYSLWTPGCFPNSEHL